MDVLGYKVTFNLNYHLVFLVALIHALLFSFLFAYRFFISNSYFLLLVVCFCVGILVGLLYYGLY